MNFEDLKKLGEAINPWALPLEDQRKVNAEWPFETLLPPRADIFVFAPGKEIGAPRQLFGRGGPILPGQVFCACHLQEHQGERIIKELVKKGQARKVGHTGSGGIGNAGGAEAFFDLDFVEELLKRGNAILTKDRPVMAERAMQVRPIYTRDNDDPASGEPIYEVAVGRAVLKVDANTSPLVEGTLVSGTWFARDPKRAEETARNYFVDRAIRQVGVYNEHGEPVFFKQADFKEAPPMMTSIVPVAEIIGGLAQGAPVFRMLKDFGGFEKGAIVTSLPLDDFFPEDLRGTGEGARVATRRIVKERLAERVGKLDHDDRGVLHVVPCDADYFPDVQGFYGRCADVALRIERSRELAGKSFFELGEIAKEYKIEHLEKLAGNKEALVKAIMAEEVKSR